MRLICSECGGQIEAIEYTNSNDSFKKYVCNKCGRERVIKENTKTIDMSETANLELLMEEER